jgi:hypothetical protein
MARKSGYIFSGTVTGVDPTPPTVNGVTTIQITLRVEQAVRGVTVGQSLSFREWAGVWNSGERYRIGEHVFLFLYPPSKLGLTSPVGGPMGRLAINRYGQIRLEQARIAAFSYDPELGMQLRGVNHISPSDLARAVRRMGAD